MLPSYSESMLSAHQSIILHVFQDRVKLYRAASLVSSSTFCPRTVLFGKSLLCSLVLHSFFIFLRFLLIANYCDNIAVLKFRNTKSLISLPLEVTVNIFFGIKKLLQYISLSLEVRC